MTMIKTLPENELEKLVDYFLNLSPEDDHRMCVDRSSLLNRDEWIQFLKNDSHKSLEDRQLYYLGWYLDDQLIGHSSINKIAYGVEALIHLHIWHPELRRHGLGKEYLWKAMQVYFEKFALQKIICEPNANNPGPNKTLIKLGLSLVDTYQTKPSPMNYEHRVNRYELTRDHFKDLLSRNDRPCSVQSEEACLNF
ncbi:MAG: GNAT family protein [Gammaproteobacteria bacterium]|nr:GNAT family protein [Gammaproteobacteria bacterium]